MQVSSRVLGDMQQLANTLHRLDGKGYKAYRYDLQGLESMEMTRARAMVARATKHTG